MPDGDDYLAFRFKPFADMTEDDYARIGFRSGLEIHQQLLTDKKLFCRCPAGKYSDVFHAEILRHMRPTLSELGEYDGTALMEFKTNKEIIYRINRDTVCTYEMDDTPPFQLNEQALDIASEIALLYDCTMVDEIHIARKQYLDGSIPTGFQRTTIVGVDGKIPFKDREIDIVQLGLEEDSCREVSDIGHRRTYIADRLGMPLIETVTAPQMITPQEVAEVGEILRRLTRSTGRVRTGIGAARQDVNVSVHGGTRIEIKGVPRLPMIPLLTYNEAMRQFHLLKLREELHLRGITSETFKAETHNVTKTLKKTRYQAIREAVAIGKSVYCVTLRGFHRLLHWPTQTDTYFGREIADRVQVIACLTTLPNILHSDSHSDAMATSEWVQLRKTVGATEDDTLVVVWGDLADVETAAKEITIRAREATIGIPSETRQALPDGTTGFERILPGPDRMYPDTDLPPKRITEERVAEIRAILPEYFWKREEWYRTLLIPADCIKPLAVSPFGKLFREAVEELHLAPLLCGVALVQYPKRLKRLGHKLDHLTENAVRAILKAHSDGTITREGILPAMAEACESEHFDIDYLPGPIEEKAARRIIEVAVMEASELTHKDVDARHRAAMRLAMKQLRGRFPGKKVSEAAMNLLKGAN